MITPELLKKYNLKAVPFEKIRDGQCFNIDVDFKEDFPNINITRRKRVGDEIYFDIRGYLPPLPDCKGDIVYIPVWFPS